VTKKCVLKNLIQQDVEVLEQDIIAIIRDLVGRHVTGHVGSGNMKINEFTQHNDSLTNFDIVDDTIVYMRNDPIFYRKKYFPAIAKMADTHRNGGNVDPESLLGSVVDQAMEGYCTKFNIARAPSELYTSDDRVNILNRITTEELEEIKKGEYK